MRRGGRSDAWELCDETLEKREPDVNIFVTAERQLRKDAALAPAFFVSGAAGGGLRGTGRGLWTASEFRVFF